jgi:NADPH2:quinone reductase
MTGQSLYRKTPLRAPPIVGGSVKPIVERVYLLGEAGEALHHLIEDRPLGKVVLAE